VEKLNRSQETTRESSKEAASSRIMVFYHYRSTESEQDLQLPPIKHPVFHASSSLVSMCDRRRSCEKSATDLILIGRGDHDVAGVVLVFRFVKHGGDQDCPADTGWKEASRKQVEAHRVPRGTEWSVRDRPGVKDGPSCAQDQGIGGDFVFQFIPQESSQKQSGERPCCGRRHGVSTFECLPGEFLSHRTGSAKYGEMHISSKLIECSPDFTGYTQALSC
jgi:hypothetical protein